MAQVEIFTFKTSNWRTPNTMDVNYKDVPCGSGVYMITKTHLVGGDIHNDVLYVGSSMDLFNRYKSHGTLNKLKRKYERFDPPNNVIVRFFFMECNNILEVEKSLIYALQPKYNKQWR